MALAADAGALAALGGQDIGVAGVGVAPAQVSLKLAGQHGVAGMIRGTDDKGAQRTELRSIGLAQDALFGVRHSSTLARSAHARMAGVLFAARLSQMTNSRWPPGRAARIDFSAARV